MKFIVAPTLPNACMLALCGLLCTAQAAEDSSAEPMQLHGQSTYVFQHKNAFSAPYAGPNSLGHEAESSYSFSASAYAGLRVPLLGELYANVEVIQGRPLSGLVGLGSFSNGEMQKVAGSNPRMYLPRLFLRRDWALGDSTQAQESAANQLGGPVATDRLRLTLGKFAITDVFDANAYSHDSRSQFLSWASLAHGSYDFAADAKGYTIGAALEWQQGDWSLRAGRFMVPEESNGEKLSFALGSQHGDQFELEHRHQWRERPGAARLLLWHNRERMGRFDEAIAAAAPGQAPAIAGVRRLQSKQGWGLHLEQELAEDLGVFARLSRGDGRTENYSFEEVDGSRQLGLQLGGRAWGRGQDKIGLLWISNQLSSVHRRYLSLGGLGFFIGDGRLNYRDERIVEAYYSWSLSEALALTLDWQHISNPAYNADRGPLSVYALRLHAEF